jgi:hypothetical protein
LSEVTAKTNDRAASQNGDWIAMSAGAAAAQRHAADLHDPQVRHMLAFPRQYVALHEAVFFDQYSAID